MHALDWAIVVAYLIYIVYDGLRLTKKSNEVEGYFLANRSLPWWAVGLSVMATQLSAITLVGTITGAGTSVRAYPATAIFATKGSAVTIKLVTSATASARRHTGNLHILGV